MGKMKEMFLDEQERSERSNPFLRDSEFNFEEWQLANNQKLNENNYPLPTLEDLDNLFNCCDELQEDELTLKELDELFDGLKN